MTSLALLAHATRAAAPAFNGLFYATAATIIPVLFLAIAVQGRFYEDLLKTSGRALNRFWQDYQAAGTTLRALAAYAAAGVTSAIAILILILGAIGEIQALLALNLQRPVSTPWLALTASVFLTLAAAGAPAAAFARFMYAIWPRSTRHEAHPAAEARALTQEPSEPGTLPGTSPEPETGKTDPA